MQLSRLEPATDSTYTLVRNDEDTDDAIASGDRSHSAEYGTLDESSGGDNDSVTSVSLPEAKTYTRRWFILALFCAYSGSNSFQWIHMNIIDDIMLKYYNKSLPDSPYESENDVDWLSLVYLLAYVPFILPAMWLLDKKGLRICCIVGALLNAIGAWIKCAAVAPDRFPLLMVAQCFCAIAQLWILGIPARLSALWFGPTEVATATALGVFGNQVGIAVGFLIPPEIVHSEGDLATVGRDLSYLFYGTAAFTSIVFLLIVVAFQNSPPHPPSHAQLVAVQAAENTSYIESLGRLVHNRGFMVLTVVYGLNTGAFYAIATLLQPTVLHYFPGEDVNAGRIGLTLTLTGVLGALLAGVWLDSTGAFKSTTLFIYTMSLLSMTLLTATAHLGHIWLMFLSAGLLGVFMTGYLPIGFEYAAEITFPESEGTSSAFLSLSCQFFGLVFTLGLRKIMNSFGVLTSNITLVGILLIAAVGTSCVSRDYRRRKAAQPENVIVNIGASTSIEDGSMSSH